MPESCRTGLTRRLTSNQSLCRTPAGAELVLHFRTGSSLKVRTRSDNIVFLHNKATMLNNVVHICRFYCILFPHFELNSTPCFHMQPCRAVFNQRVAFTSPGRLQVLRVEHSAAPPGRMSDASALTARNSFYAKQPHWPYHTR